MRAYWLAERAPRATLLVYVPTLAAVGLLAWLCWRFGWVEPPAAASPRQTAGLRFGAFTVPAVWLGFVHQLLTALGWIPVLWWQRSRDGGIRIASLTGRLGWARQRLEVLPADTVEFEVHAYHPYGWARLLRRDHVIARSGTSQVVISTHGALVAARGAEIHNAIGGTAIVRRE